MSLSSLQLDAFLEVARVSSFSQAARNLHVTQSALSQRILNLEQELGSSLFVRATSGMRLTDLGHKLLRYCQVKEGLEQEFFGEVHPTTMAELTGIVRIAGFSTVTRSVIIPSLRVFIKDNPAVKLEIQTAELLDLPRMLESGQADFIFLNHALEKQNITNVCIGYEKNVLVQPKKGFTRTDYYLDHDRNDNTTENFFRQQTKPPGKLYRSYCGEIYALIDGVLNGFGRAVVPLHIAQNYPGLEIVKGLKALKTPVYLVSYQQSYFTRLQKKLIEVLKEEPRKYLSS